jgi:hypothetical protein
LFHCSTPAFLLANYFSNIKTDQSTLTPAIEGERAMVKKSIGESIHEAARFMRTSFSRAHQEKWTDKECDQNTAEIDAYVGRILQARITDPVVRDARAVLGFVERYGPDDLADADRAALLRKARHILART